MEEIKALDDFLASAGKESSSELRKKFSSVKMKRGQFVFFEGDHASSLYFIESGIIEANAIHSDGRVYIHQFMFPGDIFGEGIVYGKERYPFSAMVRKDATLWKISREDFLQALEKDDGLKNRIIEILGKRLEFSLLKARCIAGERVEKRVACILLKTVNEKGLYPECLERIDMPITNRDISGLIGTTEETVSRIMSRLKRDGIIAVRKKQIVILDRKALTGFLSD